MPEPKYLKVSQQIKQFGRSWLKMESSRDVSSREPSAGWSTDEGFRVLCCFIYTVAVVSAEKASPSCGCVQAKSHSGQDNAVPKALKRIFFRSLADDALRLGPIHRNSENSENRQIDRKYNHGGSYITLHMQHEIAFQCGRWEEMQVPQPDLRITPRDKRETHKPKQNTSNKKTEPELKQTITSQATGHVNRCSVPTVPSARLCLWYRKSAGQQEWIHTAKSEEPVRIHEQIYRQMRLTCHIEKWVKVSKVKSDTTHTDGKITKISPELYNELWASQSPLSTACPTQ